MNKILFFSIQTWMFAYLLTANQLVYLESRKLIELCDKTREKECIVFMLKQDHVLFKFITQFRMHLKRKIQYLWTFWIKANFLFEIYDLEKSLKIIVQLLGMIFFPNALSYDFMCMKMFLLHRKQNFSISYRIQS